MTILRGGEQKDDREDDDDDAEVENELKKHVPHCCQALTKRRN